MGKAANAPASAVEGASGTTIDFHAAFIQSTEGLELALGVYAEPNYGRWGLAPAFLPVFPSRKELRSGADHCRCLFSQLPRFCR